MPTVPVDLRQAQPEGIDLIQLSYLSWLETQESERAAKYAMFRDYYEGQHETQLTARMRKFLELKVGQEFSLNACPIVVDSLAERLKVAGFECEDEKQADTFRDWWTASRMDAAQAVVHLAGVRDGDTYILVEWDNDKARPVFTQENAYDGLQGMHVVYSDERRLVPVVAIKRWTLTVGIQQVIRRTNLYFPDRIEKYSDNGTGNDWTPHIEVDENGVEQEWPIPWLATDGSPLGIPVIHFRNKDQGYSYGESELEDVVPLQNGLNKVLIDLLAAADTTGFSIYTMTGGRPDGVVTAPGSWVWSTDPGVTIGSLPGADLTSLINLKDSVMADIAKITRTPTSAFQLTGQIAAAGTLKEQRAGLHAKSADRQVVFGNSWEDVMVVGRRLNNVFGTAQMDESATVDTTWEDDETPDETELATVAQLMLHSQAASTRTRVKYLHPDWTEEEVDEEVELVKAETGMNVPDIGPLPSDNTPPEVATVVPAEETPPPETPVEA